MSDLVLQILEALCVPAAELDSAPAFTYALSTRFWPVQDQLLAQGDFRQLGRLHETVGITDYLLLAAQPGPAANRVLAASGAMIMAAYWFQKAGENERAALSARRAIAELEEFRAGENRGPDLYRWFALEMLAEAEAITDQRQALVHFKAALAGFAEHEEVDELGEASERFPGLYIEQMMRHFLPDGHTVAWKLAAARIPYKVRHWLGHELSP